MSYVIGTGWWCDGTKARGSVTYGRDYAMEQMTGEFFLEWVLRIRRELSPAKVLVVDSASPIQPVVDVGCEVLHLTENFLHACHCLTKYCGWTRAFLAGAFYALMNDMDYVFLEQDVFFRGDIVQEAYHHLRVTGAEYTHGTWSHAYGVEQSFVLMLKDAILPFINNYMAIPESDRQMVPEVKFGVAAEMMRFSPLPFGYGRERPINYDDPVFYVQQMSPEELERMRQL